MEQSCPGNFIAQYSGMWVRHMSDKTGNVPVFSGICHFSGFYRPARGRQKAKTRIAHVQAPIVTGIGKGTEMPGMTVEGFLSSIVLVTDWSAIT